MKEAQSIVAGDAPPIGGASLNFGVGRRETYFVACIAPGVSLVVAAKLERYSRKNTLQY